MRLVTNFAVIYAGLRLAAHYKILPWSRKYIWRQLKQCTDAALEAIDEDAHSQPNGWSVSALAHQLRKIEIVKVKARIRADADEAQRRQMADALLVGGELYVRAGKVRASEASYPWLRKSETRLFSGISGKKRWTVIDLNAAPAEIVAASYRSE